SFFFSSRRRHTRCLSDWSSDVCSSDLFAQTLPPTTVNYSFDVPLAKVIPNPCNGGFTLVNGTAHVAIAATTSSTGFELAVGLSRSEECRVGKECGVRGGGAR